MARTLLLVDDDPAFGGLLRGALASWRIVCTADRENARRVARAHRPPVALVSFHIAAPPPPEGVANGEPPSGGVITACPPVDGFDVLSDILDAAPACKVVMLDDGRQPRSAAVRAVAGGAHDVVCRPGDARELALLIDRAWHRHELEAECRAMAGVAAVPLRAVREQAERRAVQEALAQARGNLSAAARLLEVSRPTLYNLIRQHGIREA
ncbi:helix-turn-helix domain-containing protein [Azospirillum halopraeferens]|uniref:helix-turn-helix domain-containing protein n=1 Tax=Azospirillum halopraeferens TaxID=34010 RepID=UPI001B3BC8EE|nr:helix-turn-helix domain-containing protein [Azospirillum halopraeferens]